MCSSNGPIVMVPVAQKSMVSAAIAGSGAILNKQPASTIRSNLSMASSCSAIESGLARSSGRIFSTAAGVKSGHDEREACPPCLAPPRPLCAKKPAIRGEPMTKTIDMHPHVLADATVKLMQKEIPGLGLKMAPYDVDNAVCEVAGVAYRPFPRG